MPNLSLELDHLELANEHIARTEAHLRRMRAALEQQERRPGGSTQTYLNAVRAAENSLEVFYAHRCVILEIIQDIEDGRLADTGSSH